VERLVDNFVLNNRTHPKAAEATGSIIATQTCVGWHEGTGTMTIANGTATTTGLSCTAVSPGTLCTFTVTVTGTMAITTSAGTVTKAQIECPGITKTSEIPTSGTSGRRNADVVTVPSPTLSDPNRWCVEGSWTPYGGRAWGSNGAPQYVAVGAGDNSVEFFRDVSATLIRYGITNSAATTTSYSYTHAFSAGSTHKLQAIDNGGFMSMRADGVPMSRALVAGTEPATMTLFDTPISFASFGTSAADVYLRDFRIYRSPTCR
jgi:hypothetical protein